MCLRMGMPVMQLRHVMMRMFQARVPMPVRMRLACDLVFAMTVLVMPVIVTVGVFVGQIFVHMLMAMLVLHHQHGTPCR